MTTALLPDWLTAWLLPQPPAGCCCRYDSSIGVQGGADKLWPATLEGGVPYDCVFSGNQCEPQESYPGMW